MPVNFRETTVAGSQWSRCSEISIFNPYISPPHITIGEQTLLKLSDGQVLDVSRQNYDVAFVPASVIQLRDPETDTLLGTSITQGEVYAILYSLYRQVADSA